MQWFGTVSEIDIQLGTILDTNIAISVCSTKVMSMQAIFRLLGKKHLTPEMIFL